MAVRNGNTAVPLANSLNADSIASMQSFIERTDATSVLLSISVMGLVLITNYGLLIMDIVHCYLQILHCSFFIVNLFGIES